MKLLLSSLLLLTIIISAPPSLEARPKGSKTCPNVDGAPLVLCAANFKNYCAYFTGGECGNKVCARQTLNDCTACLDPAVLYYFKKPCTANKVYCDANGRPQSCSRKRNLVCGYYTQDCPYEICSRTLLNPCAACKDPVIKDYTKGRCRNPTDNTCLRDGRLKRCGSSSPPVCGFYTIGCPFGFCQQDYQNQCEACRDSKVIFTRPGYCQELSASCDLVDIPPVCPEAYSPVCASLRDCQGEGCTRTFDNVCFACSAGGYALFKSGICEQDRVNCDYRSDTCDAIYDPVCAFFDEPCVDGLCFATAENGCRACADHAVDYYIDGACKPASDNRVYCLPNSRPEGCPDNVDPVCAFRNIVCITTPCPNTETIFNGCTACQDPSVQYYTPGECPDDGDA